MSLLNLFQIIEKGGPNSGNRGHAGIPGKRGGSAPSKRRGLQNFEKISGDFNELLDFGLKTGKEAAMSFDEKGNRQGYLKGNDHSVPDVSRIINDSTFLTVHNHPNSDSISGGDLQFFVSGNEKHLIVLGHDGTIYKVSKPDGWVKKNFNGDNRLDDKWENKVYQAIAYGDISGSSVNTKAKKWKELTHEITKEVSKGVGLEYERF